MKYIMQKKNMHGVVRSGDGDGVAGCIFYVRRIRCSDMVFYLYHVYHGFEIVDLTGFWGGKVRFCNFTKVFCRWV